MYKLMIEYAVIWVIPGYIFFSTLINGVMDDAELYAILATLFFYLYVLLSNIMLKSQGKKIDIFSWLEPYRYEPPKESARKLKAQYPAVPEQWLSDNIEGLILGKYKKQYIRLPLKKGNIFNTIIMGAPGCGKSTLLLTTLINQLNVSSDNDRMTFFVMDIKPELAEKSVAYRGNPNVKVMNPMDRTTYGWNPYYNLDNCNDADTVMEELDVIANAIINNSGNQKNEFFYESARNIAKAVLYYTYLQGKDFIEGINYLMQSDLATVIKNVLDATESRVEYALVTKLLRPYSGKNSEAFQGIELAFRQSLSCFTTQTVQFFLSGNLKVASPNDLEDHISIFLSIPEIKIDEYKGLLRLVTMQIMHHCSGRREDSHLITLIIDEAARLGAINWCSFLATSRSRCCATVLAFQSLSQMHTCWSPEESKTLIELCRVVAVLSCTDMDTANMFCGWAGTYKEEKQTHNEGSKNKGSYSVSYEDKKILEPADLMILQELQEAVLFICGRYYRCDVVGARYYNIAQLEKISKNCVDENKR